MSTKDPGLNALVKKNINTSSLSVTTSTMNKFDQLNPKQTNQ